MNYIFSGFESKAMKITYRDNDATKIPLSVVGSCIQIRGWLKGESFKPFIKEVFGYVITQREIDEHTDEKRREDAEQADRSFMEEHYQDKDDE